MDSSAEARRYHAIDGLRGGMMLLGVVLHASLPYITVRSPQGFKDPSTSVAFDLLVLFLHSFYTLAFFVAAGFFAALLLDRRGAAGMAANRFQRVFLPLVVGWLVLAPLTRGAYQFAKAVASSGSVASGIDALSRGNWLRWDNPFHLWFLIALLALYPSGVAVQWGISRLPERHLRSPVKTTRQALSSPWRPVFLAILGSFGFIPAAFYPFGRINVYLAAAIALFFGLGWVLHAQRDLLGALRGHAWTYVAVGIAVLPLAGLARGAAMLVAPEGGVVIYTILAGGLFSIMAAFMVFGVIGLFLAYFNRPSAVMRYLSDASYWIYLVHMPLVVLIGGMLSSISLPAALKLAVTITAATVLLLLSYHHFVRFTVIGVLLNGRRHFRHRDVAVVAG